jgi:Tfp pilus assembly protein PilF
VADEQIDKKIKDLADTALKLGDENQSWIWKLIGTIMLGISLWYLRNELEEKTAELAKARTELALQKLEAQQKLAQARFQELQLGAKGAEEVAKKELAAVLERETQIRTAEEVHRKRVEQIEKIRDWKNLNKDAGVS